MPETSSTETATARPVVATTMDEEWEEWTPDKGSFLSHVIAGSVAGLTEHVSIFPIDTIKTHMQCQHCPRNREHLRLTTWQTARRLVEKEGPLRLFRGVSTMLSGAVPAHAVYFSVFESAKSALGADRANLTPLASGTAGVIATVCHDVVMTPLDVVKQRLQLGYYGGLANCFKAIIRQEGVRALYISFPTTLFMNLPFSMIMVSTNETMKKILNPSGQMNVSAYLVSGVVSGALAGALTTPLDVAKTRLQTQMLHLEEEAPVRTMSRHTHVGPSASRAPLLAGISTISRPQAVQLQERAVQLSVPQTCAVHYPNAMPKAGHRHQYRGLFDALVQIRAQEGFRAFFRGIYPRVLVNAPSVAVSWTTFEVLKKTLDKAGI